jgi:hypothetical protein
VADERVEAVLDRYGRTFAEEAGIRLADRPAPLYQLLVLATLLSARISAGVAVAAARELFGAGYRTPQAMLEGSWQDRVDALGRGHYRRYDERTATMLGDGARLCRERWRGDLRRLHAEAGGDVARLRTLLVEFPGLDRHLCMPGDAEGGMKVKAGISRRLGITRCRARFRVTGLCGRPVEPRSVWGRAGRTPRTGTSAVVLDGLARIRRPTGRFGGRLPGGRRVGPAR